MLPTPVNPDSAKIATLKKLGVWNSIQTLYAVPDISAVTYSVWTTEEETSKGCPPDKVCRLSLEFRPSIVLRDKEAHAKFLGDIFDIIHEFQELYAPDLPDRIQII